MCLVDLETLEITNDFFFNSEPQHENVVYIGKYFYNAILNIFLRLI